MSPGSRSSCSCSPSLAAAVLYWFFRSVRLGIVMRGVVDNHELVSMSGDDPVRVRRWAWIIGTVFASIAGLLLAPTQALGRGDPHHRRLRRLRGRRHRATSPTCR